MNMNTRTLTPNQLEAISELRKADFNFLASATERNWLAGKTYYIDSRVPVTKRLRKMFEKGNRDVD